MATNKEHYTVLTMNFGGYELIHPIGEKSDRCTYIMVTDDPTLKDDSGSWTIVYDNTLTGTPWRKCMEVRYYPFKYTDDDIVIKVDGSVGINKSLDKIVDKFNEESSDISLMFHPGRNTLYDEYSAWVQLRGYDHTRGEAILNFLQMMEGYNVKEYKGLAQLCWQIQRRNKLNEDLNRMTLAYLYYLGDKEEPDRVDQCIFSFVAQKYFATQIKILWFDQRLYQGEYFTWYPHNSNIPFQPADVKTFISPYWNNTKVHNYPRPQDL